MTPVTRVEISENGFVMEAYGVLVVGTYDDGHRAEEGVGKQERAEVEWNEQSSFGYVDINGSTVNSLVEK